MDCAIVVLYEPDEKAFINILSYCKLVDCVFVLDNSAASNEIQVEKIFKGDDIRYQYIHFGKNVGLARAFNYGMAQASKEGFEWALLMDSDSSLLNNIVSIYKNFLKGDTFVKPNENLKPARTGKIEISANKVAVLAPVHLFDRSKNHVYEGSKELKWSMTSGCYFNVNLFHKLGGFKNELFVDGIDLEYGYRANMAGYEIIELGQAALKHFPGETRILKIGNMEIFKYGHASAWRYYMQTRALIYVLFKYKSLSSAATYIYKWAKIVLFFENKKNYIQEVLRGTMEGYRLYKMDKKNQPVPEAEGLGVVSAQPSNDPSIPFDQSLE